MAYEPSEGLYAGLSLLPTSDLNEATRGGQKFLDLYNTAVNMLKESGDIKEKGTATRNGLVSALDLTKLTEKKVSEVYDDLAGAISAVLATRKDVNNSVPETVYLTGNKWHKDVEEFKVDACLDLLQSMLSYQPKDRIADMYTICSSQVEGSDAKKQKKA